MHGSLVVSILPPVSFLAEGTGGGVHIINNPFVFPHVEGFEVAQ